MRDIKIEPNRSVERIISILNCFSFERNKLSIEEIVKETSLPKATTYRMLWTLEKNGLIHYDSKDNKYRLGHKFLEYGGIVLNNLDIRSEAEPILSNLHDITGHTILFAIKQKNVLQYLLSFEGKEEFQPSSYMGRSRVLHYGALGITIMAYMSINEVKDIISQTPLVKKTPYTLTNEDEFYKRLKKIQGDGFYVDVDETFVGFTAVSAPVFGNKGKIVGAIGVAGASFKMVDKDRERIVALTKQAAQKISQRLGYV